ncbi:MAG: hypothetical protein A2233_04090 [Candidatus Kerfeldbacteria bacterium RIFOXYA2_FULL_38_24]|uniref:Uncharacterized protein n=1 Tax=Candidatus Kerfeldbacteria bacterium RIFOXYB2_FULL_38_14 TaxID=1798547 RepID=A0A1G2BBY4_9BACT|nr:MAG: hypothetical protein A2233_04090 [Candidatus Kerfeldbacteria bacterium RIFOXYA2_FULL_38_24]OGY86748.1 MAG: hypothetical protein A2319_00825 [Candidatus Kerfeldbacteria bacterium RIFOXYB2_FULL_38_14]
MQNFPKKEELLAIYNLAEEYCRATCVDFLTKVQTDALLSISYDSKFINRCLDYMSQVFADQKNYLVFGSTATYVYATQLGIKKGHKLTELLKLPGDFDATIFEEKTLQTIIYRLFDLPQHFPEIERVEFEKNAVLQPLPNTNTTVVAGSIRLSTPRSYNYDFEFFYNPDNTDAVITAQTQQHTTFFHGLRVLDIEGIYEQVKNILRVEMSIEDEIQLLVYDFTKDPEIIAQVKQDFLRWQKQNEIGMSFYPQTATQVLQKYNLNFLTLAQLYVIQNKIDQAFAQHNYHQAEKYITQRSVLLSRIKTKIAKRLRNLEILQELLKK